MDFVDSNYEFNAPQYVDFLNDADDNNIDKWFDEHPGHEGGIRLSMVPFVEKPSDFESVTKAISAALVGNAEALQNQQELPACSVSKPDENRSEKHENLGMEREPAVTRGTDQHKEVANTTVEMADDTVDPAENLESVQREEDKNGNVPDPPKVPSNIVKSWKNFQKNHSGPQQSRRSADKSRTPVTRSRSMERPKSLKRKSDSLKTKDDTACVTSEVKKSKMEIKKPMLTVAHTPELLRRQQDKKTHTLSTEDAELAMVKKLKNEAIKMKKRSVHSYKKAMASGPYMPTRSKVEVTHPVDFTFATDTRVKPHAMTLRNESNKTFETQLRQHPPSPSFKNRKATKPVPFHFAHETKEMKDTRIPGKWESMASSVSNFQTKTPDRFRSHPMNVKPDHVHAENKHVQPLKLTKPKTPHLTAKARKRPVTAPSQADEEEKIVQEMKSYKFKARELDPRIIEGCGIIGLPQKIEHPKTEPKPFEFMSDVRLEARKKKDDMDGNTDGQGKKRSGSASQKSAKERCTRPEPFSFEERNKVIQLRKEKKIQEILEEEQRAREFHAQPLPSLSPDIVIHHDHKKTEMKPFKLESERRHVLCEQKWNEQMNRMKDEERAKQIFKANPNIVAQKAPFQPIKGQIPGTEFSEFRLNTEERAHKREEFDAKLKEYQRLALEEMEEQKMMEEKEAEKEIALLRQQAVPKANPIRKYREVEVMRSDKPLTNPQTPQFETVKRSKRGIRV